MRSTEMAASSVERLNAFIACDASPAACEGVSWPREPAARSSTGLRRLMDSVTL
jgi:hypothetical protein